MQLSLPTILRYFPKLNKKPHSAFDFWQTVHARNIDVIERRLKRKGYYVPDVSGEYIFIDSRLRDYLWLSVAYHELVHAILHYPSPFLANKHQFEANAFSLMAICPLSEMDAGSEFRESAKYNHVLKFILREREKLWFLYRDFNIKSYE